MLKAIRNVLCAAACTAAAVVWAEDGTTCVGKFPNPVSDICWPCMYPITVGGVPFRADGQDIPGDNGSPECICPAPPPVFERVGVTTGFFEPARTVDVTRKPFCLVGLGGIDVGGGGGMKVPHHGRQGRDTHGSDGSFYQAHWYANPLAYILEMVLDAVCMESGGIDLIYLTEVDPLWNNDELTNILNFESALFSNPIVQATCAIDCVAASTFLPVPFMFWCAGCNGPMFPLDGFVPAHIGGVQAASLVSQRLTHKLQRELVEWTFHTYAAVCGPFPNPIIDKVAFKQQILYPVPQTAKAPYCCNWQGNTTVFTGAGKEYPYEGEDFSFMLYRKRVCCVL